MAISLSAWIISIFLSHLSLLDGAPRSSLQLYLTNQAEKPFAYRMLAPAIVRRVDSVTPEPLQLFLSEKIAPKFFTHYVAPLGPSVEKIIPGITQWANKDWEEPAYRRSYVWMVVLMFVSFATAMLLLRQAILATGVSARTADLAMFVYAVITPTTFLNGGYFYDFTEQLGATALLFCVIKAHWILGLITVLLMQMNKETAFLMIFFTVPFAWHIQRWHVFSRVAIPMLLCFMIFLWIRLKYSYSPGQSAEWHLSENIDFWMNPSSWTKTNDFYHSPIMLPRMTYLYFTLATLVAGLWKRQITPALVSTLSAFFILGGLMLTKGFADEFRAIGLMTPLLILLLSELLSDIEK